MFWFGIDFGTTNSACIGIEDKRRVKKFSDDEYPFPSLVIIDRMTGRVYCGREAWRRREELRESCEVIPSIKTYLGTDKTWKIAGRIWTPEMVAAQVFLGLKERVKKRLGTDELKEAVIAVPVGFSPAARAALRKAARMAGIEVKSFVSEPTAALFYHYNEIGHNTRIGVFDWGGGTLDVSVIENRNGCIKELATGGINKAGDYIDRLMAEWIHRRIVRKSGQKISFDDMPAEARDKMLTACEQAKRDLTWDDTAQIQILDYGPLGDVFETIDIEQFTLLINPVIDDAISCFGECLERSGMNIAQLDCILMVGGSVNLRPFNERIAEFWEGKEYYPEGEPEWSVAGGAARLSINEGKHILTQTVGVVMSDGSLYPLFAKGHYINSGDFSTATFALVEDAPAANLVFADGTGNALGYLSVPAFGFFGEKIEVIAWIDEDLILRIKARSLNRSEKSVREWQYDSLRMEYELPVMHLEVDEDDYKI
ncbi:molecular chaperone DnaK [Thermosyntropha lipolytica DSM 11003]|uniref:Molecular chaperone DnaK n=1 Tax=Thermosyntropha lipolytica DSM 11003 TaxID=1123382 RepID=A0A1M5QX59_9FIRM|nr:Hsp70 family protein [Thermosyntropha lipolytica]SHH18757.1 molecular chaperone DnaK [Thermosyntropha lipolytica DSM 11003]